MSYASIILADAPVGYWRFGEASGNPQDSAGTNHVTSVSGSPTYGVTGALTNDPNKAITFPDLSAMSVPDANALDVGDIFSVEFWLKRVSGVGDGEHHWIINKGLTGGTGPMVFINGDTLELGAVNGAVNVAYCDTSITDTTTFHHGVVTKNGSTIHWYLDGPQTPDDIGTPTTFSNTTSPLLIGGNGAAFKSLMATLDELVIYNYALTAGQVAAHYAARTALAALPVSRAVLI